MKTEVEWFGDMGDISQVGCQCFHCEVVIIATESGDSKSMMCTEFFKAGNDKRKQILSIIFFRADY